MNVPRRIGDAMGIFCWSLCWVGEFCDFGCGRCAEWVYMEKFYVYAQRIALAFEKK